MNSTLAPPAAQTMAPVFVPLKETIVAAVVVFVALPHWPAARDADRAGCFKHDAPTQCVTGR